MPKPIRDPRSLNKKQNNKYKDKNWEPDTKTLRNYASFDAYVADFPEAEHYRYWLTSDGKDHLVIIESRARLFSGSLPGGFYWVFSTNEYVDYKGVFREARVIVMGCDDGCLEKSMPQSELDNEFEEIMTIEHRDLSWFEERGYEYGD